MKDKTCDSTLIKFLSVGIANTFVGAGIMFVLYNIFHVSYWIASFCNYIVGGIVSFVLNKYFTFKNKTKSIQQFFLFWLNLILCYGIAYGVARPVVSWLVSSWNATIRDNVSMIVGMMLYTALNYLGQRLIFLKGEMK